MELISGLPNDIARDCLVRVEYNQFPNLVSICKNWKIEILSSEFRSHRKITCKSQRIVVLVQARVKSNQSLNATKHWFGPVYRLTLFEPDTGHWFELPPIPGLSDRLPMFCQVVGIGSELVVLGGLHPVTMEVSKSVFIYNFMRAKWRCGSDMPGVQRSFFSCVSDMKRMVCVVGGHDGNKNALRSAMAYDVANNKWTMLPDMANERDECKALFHRGKLHVVGGYRTEKQGWFERSAEVYDFTTGKWDSVKDDFLETPMCPSTCVSNDDVDLHMCCSTDVIALKGSTWQPVAKLPADLSNTAHVTAWKGKMLVIGSPSFGEPHAAYVLDMENYTWKKIEISEQYSGHVQSGCCLEI